MSEGMWFGLVFVFFIILKSVMSRRSPEEKQAMKDAIANGGLIVDVRSPAEYRGGHIEGSKNIPVGQLGGRLKELGSKDRAIVVCCASGARSRAAQGQLRAAGFTNVHDLGPWIDWR